MNALLVAAGALASAPPDPADVKPGWLALVIVALIGLATFLLWRSMNNQLKKVHFDNGSTAAPGGHQAVDESDDHR